jgi:hypothetical protein
LQKFNDCNYLRNRLALILIFSFTTVIVEVLLSEESFNLPMNAVSGPQCFSGHLILAVCGAYDVVSDGLVGRLEYSNQNATRVVFSLWDVDVCAIVGIYLP